MTRGFSAPEVFLDHAAGTPPLPGVLAAEARLRRGCLVNPHSTTCFGAECQRQLHLAEQRVLTALGVPPDDMRVVWTSGGTEALNLAVHGVLANGVCAECQVDAAAHAAMLEPAEMLAREHGRRFSRLPVAPSGGIDIPEFEAASRPLVGITHVNNETGAVQDLAQIRHQLDAGQSAAVLLVDALQSAGKIALPWSASRPDLIALGGRKFGGPCGVGALLIRRGLKLAPLMHGGGQQGGLRPGTVDTVGAMLFADALGQCCVGMAANRRHVEELRRHLLGELAARVTFAVTALSPEASSPYITCLILHGFEGAVVMRLLAESGIVVGSGSACSAESAAGSHVLRAMGLDAAASRGALRVSFSYDSTGDEVTRFVGGLQKTLTEY